MLSLVAALLFGQAQGFRLYDDFLAKGQAVRLNCIGSNISCTLDAGTAHLEVIASLGSGAPTDATYLTQTCNAGLSNEQCMSALGTGLVLNTTTTGVQSIYAGTSCTNQLLRSLNASGAGTCASVDLASDVTGSLPGASVSGAVATATALANTTQCAGGEYMVQLATNGNAVCNQVDASELSGSISLTSQVTGTLPFANGGNGITRLANDVAVAVNASYVTVFTVTGASIGNNKNVSLDFRAVYIATANTVGMQFRVRSADTGYVGNCAFITWGVSGTAASATAIETDIIAIGTAPADTAAAAACAAAPCIVDVECSLTSDASAGDVLLEAQLETGTSSAPIKAGSSFYRLITN